MRYLLFVIVSAASLIMLAGCGGGAGPQMGTVELKVSFSSGTDSNKTRSISEITEIRVTVSAPDINPIVRYLKLDPETHTASDRFLVPAGNNRRFLAEALDASNTIIYRGESKEPVTIPPDKVTSVEIILSPTPGSVEVVVIIHEGPPGIEFTYVPPIGSFEDLRGRITGGYNPENLAVAVYIKVGEGWWTKPYWDSPLTYPNSDGTWVCDITTGGHDETATEILAFLVWRTTEVPLAAGSTRPEIPEALAWVSQVRK